jgi:hypothetical protein
VAGGTPAILDAPALYHPTLRPGLHLLSRTFATELLGRGIDVETVRQLVGCSEKGKGRSWPIAEWRLWAIRMV